MDKYTIYFGKSEFYDVIRKIGGQWNDSKERPIVCLIKLSENDDIYWAIPMGNWNHRDKKGKDRIQKYYLTIQMLHNGLNRRIRDIIGWNVDRLERSDGTLGCGVDALLDLADIRIQSCRITILDRHTVLHGADLGISLNSTVNVINEQKYVLILLVTEILCQSQTGIICVGSASGVLTHLSKYHGDLI